MRKALLAMAILIPACGGGGGGGDGGGVVTPPAPPGPASGSLDSSFGGTGVVSTAVIPGADQATAIVIQADGRIVVVGNANGDIAMLRYNSDGSLDGTFGASGVVITDLGGGETAQAVTLQTDGKIVVAGMSGT